MDEAQLRELIRQILRALVPPRALVLFTGAALGFDDAVAQIAALKAGGWVLDGLQTPSAQAILDQSTIGGLGLGAPTGALARTHDLLLVPTLSTNTTAKVAHGIADDLASNVIAGFLRENRPIVVAREGSCPDCAARRAIHPNTPTPYRRLLRSNLQTLADFGVVVTGAATLAEAARAAADGTPPHAPARPVAPTRAGTPPSGRPRPSPAARSTVARRVLGEREIQAWPEGSPLRVPAGTRITPLARDAARVRGITITQEEGS